MPRPTKKQIARAIQAFAPAGMKNEDFPNWVNKAASRKSPTTNRREEDALQMACCDFLNLHPRILYFSVPNHIFRGKQSNEGAFAGYMARQKRMGLKRGVSDLIMLFRNRDNIPVTVCAELKMGRNVPSPPQAAFLIAAEKRGAFVGVVRSLDDLQALLSTAGF